MTAMSEEESASTPRNGNADRDNVLDPGHPDIGLMAGVLVRVEAVQTTHGEDIRELRGMLIDQGGVLGGVREDIGRICKSLGIEPTKTIPPFRAQLDSVNTEIDALKKTDVKTSEELQAVKKEAAEAVLVNREVKDKVIRSIYPTAKRYIAIIAAALAVLAGIAKLWWESRGK